MKALFTNCEAEKLIKEFRGISISTICEGSQVVKGAALRALSCRGSGVRILALAFISL